MPQTLTAEETSYYDPLSANNQPTTYDDSAPPPPAQSAPVDMGLIRKTVSEASEYFNVPPGLLAGMLSRESAFRPEVIDGRVRSKAGATGIAQLLPSVADEMGVDPTNVRESIAAAAAILRRNLDKFGDPARAVAAYNWGPNRKALERDDWASVAPGETRQYVDYVLSFNDDYAKATAPQRSAQRALPDGVTPSTAGAGRGSVNPPAAQPEQPGLLQTMADSLRRGVPSMLEGFSATSLRSNAATLSNVDSVEKKLAAGQTRFTLDEDPLGVASMTPEQRQQLRRDATGAAGGNAASIAAAEATKAQYPAPDVVNNVMAAKGWREALSAFSKDPIKFIASIGPESMISNAPGLIAGAMMPGGAVAKAATLGAGSVSTDYGSQIIEGLKRAGVDTQDPEAVQAAAKNPELMSRIARESMAHALPVGALDALSGGVAGEVPLPAKVLAKSPLKRELANVVAQVPVQGALGGTGEALGEINAGQDLDPGNIIAEIAGEGFGAPAEVAGIGRNAVAERLHAARASGGTNFTPADSASAKAGLAPIVVPGAAPAASAETSGGATSFTPADSPSAKAGLAPIVVPDMAPEVAAKVAAKNAEIVAPTTTPAEARLRQQIAEASSQSAEDKLAERMRVQLGIPSEKNTQGTTQEITDGNAQQQQGEDVDGPQVAQAGGPAEALAASQRSAEAGSQAAGRKNESSRLNGTAETPAETWRGRSRNGYATQGDASMAIEGRAKRFPDLDWRVERDGERYVLNGYPTWQGFPEETGTKGIPRAEMPQVQAEHRGALVNFLNARGIEQEHLDVDPNRLKPTQAEFSPAKVREAAGITSDRSVLISSDNHVLDGHHQWLAAKESGTPVKAIRLDAPIGRLLDEVRQFPSASTSTESTYGNPYVELPQPQGSLGAGQAQAAATAAGTAEPAAPAGRGFEAEGAGPGLSFSKQGDQAEQHALRALSQHDELFKLPKSSSDSLEGVAADIDPQIQVHKRSTAASRTNYDLTMPDGTVARLVVRKPNPYGPDLYGYNVVDGEMTDPVMERPGENAEDVPHKDDVWIDVSQLKGSGDGTKVYAIAQNFAHNTGRIFVGDPAGLSDDALVRRADQMLSSALKFGTTEHLAPHPRQVAGDLNAGVLPLNWRYGDHAYNIRSLIDVILKAHENAGADFINFNPEDGQFHDSEGNAVPRDVLTAAASLPAARRARAGGTGLARAAVLRALLREESSSAGSRDGRSNGLLARVLRLGAVHPQATSELFYSRGSGSRGLTSVSELRDAFTTRLPGLSKALDKMLARGEQGKAGGLVTLESADPEAMAQALAEKTGRSIGAARRMIGADGTQAFQSSDGRTQGFFDPKSGLTFVVLPNVSPQSAAGVILHEAVHTQQRTDLDAKALAMIDGRDSPAVSKKEREFLDRVAQRMADAGESGNAAEATSYLVEQAVHEGRQAGHSAIDGKFLNWVDATFGKRAGNLIRDLVASLRQWALKHGADISPTVDDLVAFAKAGVEAASRGEVGEQSTASASRVSRKQTLTPEFRRWFGDSKIVDAKGRPLLMIHDTAHDFTEFKTRNTGSTTGNTGAYGEGAYFYAHDPDNPLPPPIKGRKRLHTYLSLQKPFDFDDSSKPTSVRDTVARILALKGLTSEERARGQKLLREWGRDWWGPNGPASGKRLPPTAGLAVETIFARPAENGVSMEGRRLRDLLEANGFDGVIARNPSYHDDGDEYVAFHPEQIKSATDNNGNFDVANLDIRYSRVPLSDAADLSKSKAPAGSPPEETRLEGFRRVVQDQALRLKTLRDWAANQGVDLSEDSDVYSHAERSQARGLARIEDFREKTLQPLIENTTKAGFSLEDVSTYLHNAHAEERNAQIARLDPEFKDGSGITNEDARAYLKKADPRLADIAHEWQDLTNGTLSTLHAGGLVSDEAVKRMKATYQNYVPLKQGNLEKTAQRGRGLSVAEQLQRATGQKKGVDTGIVANIVADRERAIAAVEKNRVGHSLLAFASELQRPDIISVGEPEKQRSISTDFTYDVTNATGNVTFASFEDEQQAYDYLHRSGQASGMRVRRTIANQHIDVQPGALAENEAQVFVHGHAVRVQLNDEALKRAYLKLDVTELPVYLRTSRDINRVLARMYTSANPTFALLTNPIRDASFGTLTLIGDHGVGTAARVWAQYPASFAKLLAYTFRKKSSAAIEMYRASGAGSLSSGSWVSDSERASKLQAAVDEYVGALALARQGKGWTAAKVAAKKMLGAIASPVEHLAATTEAALRLATFEVIEKKDGVRKAASAARRVTVDFSRKGSVGQHLSALYLFANPAIQGSTRFMQVMTTAEHARQAQALVAGLVAAGAGLLMMGWGGSDDDRREWDLIPDHVRSKNIVIRTGPKSYITIPIGQEIGMLWAVARAAFDSTAKNADFDRISLDMASAVVEAFLPFNPIEGAKHWRDIQAQHALAEMTPGIGAGDLVREAARIAVNRTFYGAPIVPESEHDQGKPDNMKMNRSTRGSAYDEVAKSINRATGGTDTQAGAIDVSPETLKFWWRAVSGGLGTFLADSYKLGELAAHGAVDKDADAEALKPTRRESLFVNKLFGENDESATRSEFYSRGDEIKRAKEDLGRARKAHDEAGVAKVTTEQAQALALVGAYASYSKRVSRIRDEQEQIARDATMSMSKRRAAIQELVREEEETERNFLRAAAP